MQTDIDFGATGRAANNLKAPRQRPEPPKDKFGRCTSCGLKDYHSVGCAYWKKGKRK